ncbi:MAG: non-hydrolyzing UDP-N-acetylglucosamine 2-epimerase [Candidatus Babeliales bacterium]
MKPIILVIGTRPEGIKMIPLYYALKRAKLPVLICSTNQHNNLLQEAFDLFSIKPDFELHCMVPGQDLFHITQKVLEKIKEIFVSVEPSLVIVQGDTTTAMTAALAAFYLRIPLAHVEAGLRTPTIDLPFPEEMNRRFISMVAQLHFAPTATAAANLLSENIERQRVLCTGNTVVDALRIMEEKIKQEVVLIDATLKAVIEENKKHGKKIILVTAHRRESFNGGIKSILTAIKTYAQKNPDTFFIYPYHPNPNVLQAIQSVGLDGTSNIFMCKPVAYKDLVYILLQADIVASDSGGICEEAASLGKPTLILRNETERMEAVWEGVAHLVGTDEKNITDMLQQIADTILLSEPKKRTIFGDGYAAEKMVQGIKNFFMHDNSNVLDHKKIKPT